ncbi:UNVERIFIED_CONTAM: Labd-13Z-ene-9,15,16-triol synthase, chloroplastic [Sesamum radiatum]|uniref:Labd-13Z-ene-9,15,16-triol synthase, chloroplastic n=1 Tax=Sesamum radiatum TaxID=300843 RepID=A0AAW2TZ09_SESRA
MNQPILPPLVLVDIQEIERRNSSISTRAQGPFNSWLPTISARQLASPIHGTRSKIWPDLQAPAGQQTLHGNQLPSSDKRGGPRSRHDFRESGPSRCSNSRHRGLDIFWAPYGPYWRDMRKLFVREMLSNNNLQASYVLRKEEVAKVLRDVSMKIGKPIEIGELVFLTELNVILSLLWGGTIDAETRDRLGAEFRDKVSKLVDLLGKPNVSDYFPVLAKFDVQGIEKEMRAVVPGVEEILDSVIDERMKMVAAEGGDSSAERGKDLLGILLELKEQQVGEGSSFGLTQIKAVLMDIVVGGTDTTATTVEWVMAELLHNPDIMKKVQEELTDVIGENNVAEESHITKLHYLDAVVKETFRLHPPLPLLVPRFPSQSCVVGGYMIPKHSQVFLNMWSISMDPQIWENPSEFRPDRFLNNTANLDYMGNNVQYLPFGSGRRVCPGLPLGEKMVMYLLATLLHSFEWRLPEDETVDLSEKFGIVMRKKTPLLAIPYRRF